MPKKKIPQQYKNDIFQIKDAFRDMTNRLCRQKDGFTEEEFTNLIERTHCTPTAIKRRMNALKNFLPNLHSAFASKYSDFVTHAIVLCGVGSSGTPPLVERFHTNLAVAIWLLDYFVKVGFMSDVLKILPPLGYRTIEEYGMPSARDSVHADELVAAMVNLIVNRNKDAASQERFAEVMSLVSDRAIRKLKNLYEENILDYIEVYIEFDSSFDNGFMRFNTEAYGHFMERIHYQLNAPTEHIEYLYGKVAAEKISQFGKGNPYEICAAHFFLEIADDDLIHLLTPSTATLFYGACRLPWSNKVDIEDDFFSVSDPIEYDLEYENNNNSYSEFIAEETQVCPLCASEDEYYTVCNLQQILYSINKGQIPPRNLRETHAYGYLISDWNVPESTLCNTLNTLDTMMANRSAVHIVLAEDDEEESVSVDELSVEDLKHENKQLLLYIKELKSALKRERHTSSNYSRELEKQRETSKRESDELVSLREAIFNLQQETSCETPAPDISFPYETQKKICVFGGNTPWRKAIKSMLPNVKFISSENAPNQDLVKTADEIWIHIHSLPHGYFYGIINIVRTNKIPLKYFGFSGAQKCAEQLVAEETKILVGG